MVRVDVRTPSGLCCGPNSVTTFRPLEAEVLAGPAGWHDGFRIFQTVARSGDAMVAAHEHVHGYLFHYTPDGNLLRSSMMVAAACSDAGMRRSAEVLRDALLASARSAHEVFATYLGIKRGDPALRKAWFDELTNEYQAYYRQLADVVDPKYRNPGLQRLLALGTALVVFDSPLLARLDSDLSALLPLLETEHAGKRLEIALRALSVTSPDVLLEKLQASADATARSRGAHTFDLNAIEEWETKYEPDAAAVERAVTIAYQDWLLTATGLSTLDDASRAEHTTKLVAISRRAGLPAETRAPATRQKDRLARELEQEASELLESRLQSSRTVFPPKGLFDGPVVERLLRTSACFVVVMHESQPGVGAWSIECWDGHTLPSVSAAPSGHATFESNYSIWQLLSEWQARRRAGTPVPRLLAFLAAVTNLEGLESCRARLAEECPDALPAACWYWLGSRSDLVRGYERWQGPIRSASCALFPPAATAQGGQPLDGMRVVLFDVPAIGFVFRILNVAAAAALAAADAERWQDGRFLRFDDAERFGIVERATAVVTRIRNSF